MKVHDILSQKGNNIYSINPDASVYEALSLMAEKNLGSLIVKKENKLVGIFTERDYARKVILKGKFSRETSVAEVMNANPLTVTEDDTIEKCMDLMTNKFVRHLPVINNGELVGVISIGDVVKFIINEQRYLIDNLDKYISGGKGNL